MLKKTHSERPAKAGVPTYADMVERLRAVAAMPEDQIDTSDPDAPEVLDWSIAIRGRFYRPTKRLLTLRVDADVIDWFKRQAGGQGGYQTAMNRALRETMLRGLRQQSCNSYDLI
jgi:uncharacterized protein (DUF4415 family)